MEIGSIGASAGSSVQSNVTLQKKAQKQEEAVVGTLLEGIKDAPRPDGKGVRVNAVA